jgi:hypothetical protein
MRIRPSKYFDGQHIYGGPIDYMHHSSVNNKTRLAARALAFPDAPPACCCRLRPLIIMLLLLLLLLCVWGGRGDRGEESEA